DVGIRRGRAQEEKARRSRRADDEQSLDDWRFAKRGKIRRRHAGFSRLNVRHEKCRRVRVVRIVTGKLAASRADVFHKVRLSRTNSGSLCGVGSAPPSRDAENRESRSDLSA